jgi:hypothetical protein
VVLAVPVAARMPLALTPSALRRTIRAHRTCFRGVLRSATGTSSRYRSVSPRVAELPVRMRQTRMCRCQRGSRPETDRLGQSNGPPLCSNAGSVWWRSRG